MSYKTISEICLKAYWSFLCHGLFISWKYSNTLINNRSSVRMLWHDRLQVKISLSSMLSKPLFLHVAVNKYLGIVQHNKKKYCFLYNKRCLWGWNWLKRHHFHNFVLKHSLIHLVDTCNNTELRRPSCYPMQESQTQPGLGAAIIVLYNRFIISIYTHHLSMLLSACENHRVISYNASLQILLMQHIPKFIYSVIAMSLLLFV